MRVETVFARGRRTALKWMALFGAVFALGAGSASAQQVTIDAPDTVSEGGRADISVSATAIPGNATTTVVVAATAAPATSTPAEVGDYALDPSSVSFEFPPSTAPNPNPQTMTDAIGLATNADADADDDVVRLTFSGTSNGASIEVPDPLDIVIVDTDEPSEVVAPKPQGAVTRVVEEAIEEATGTDEQLDPGEGFSVESDDLFEVTVTVQLTATSSDPSVATVSVGADGTITVTARSAGTATITVTATETSPSGEVVIRTTANSATVEFDVTVGPQPDVQPLEITLSGPADTTLVEGGRTATVTATTNRAVIAETTVELFAPVGGFVTASDDDYRVGPITIRAGGTTGTTVLTAVEDGQTETAETLVLRGRAGSVRSSNSLTFTIYDAAVPTLPVIAQLLLAAFLAIGGYRRYLRRR